MGVAGLAAGAALGLLGLGLIAWRAQGSPPTLGRLSPGRVEALRGEALPPPYAALAALHRPKREPQAHDWLAQHPEPGQSLREYLAADPVRATAAVRTIALVRVGDFTPEQRRVVDLTRDYLGLHFQLPLRELEPIPAGAIPQQATRKNPLQGQLQWSSHWMLTELLPALRPEDSVSLVALTAVDLWPGPGWNFVFGEATLTERVGVWSIARHGDAAAEPSRVLSRTIKVAAHELGHMFSMHHCVAWECVMNGGNSLEETDLTPLEPCPACLAKLQHATGLDVARRFAALRAFLDREGLAEEAAFVARSQAAVQGGQ